jgi:hypothetical protein
MTSNFTIGNPAAAPTGPTPNAASSVDMARVLNPAAQSVGTPIYGGQLMAGAPRKLPTASQGIMNRWHKALEPTVNRATSPQEIGKPLVIPVSRPGKSTGAPPQNGTIGGTTWKAQDVPEFSGKITPNLLAALNIALTPKRVLAFQRLTEDQKTTMRTLLGAGLHAMSLPPGSFGRIDPKYMNTVVETALKYAQQTPTALDSPARRTATTPTTQPVQAAPSTRAQTTPRMLPEQSARTPTTAQVEPTAPQTPVTDPISLAIKMRNFGNSAAAIASPKNYIKLLDSLDGLPIPTIVRIGYSGVNQFNAETLSGRSRQYRDASIRNLSTNMDDSYFSMQMSRGNGGKSHQLHTVAGATSKLGEVHAASQAFTFAQRSWESRGKLPGQDGKSLSAFWGVQGPAEWSIANEVMTSLESTTSPPSPEQFSRDTVAPLLSRGFIPKGAALSTRLEQLESAIAQRDTLQKQLDLQDRTPSADLAKTRALRKQLKAATQDVERGLADTRGRAAQSRNELLMQSLGTPKTTYELTIRHAAAARYMQSIEGQANARFSASKFKAIMADARNEALQGRSEIEVSLLWHRALIERYSADKTFDKAMGAEGTPMREAWSAYKALYGMGPKGGMSPKDAHKTLYGQ